MRLLPLFCSLVLCVFASASPKPKGTLVIVGGGGMPAEVQEAFFRAAGGKGGVVGVIPTASEDPEGILADWKADLDKAGLKMVPLDIRSREQASSPELLTAAAACTGFWFSGGDQNRTGDKVVGTPFHRLVLERYRAGAGVGGTSAGAAIMSRIMLTGEDRNGKELLSEIGPAAYRTREGLGFLPDFCIVDQHFLRRNRQNRLLSLVMDHPGALGLGIDEATALVLKDGVAKVTGASGVLVFDARPMRTDAGGGFRNLRLHLLRPGQRLILATRAIQP